MKTTKCGIYSTTAHCAWTSIRSFAPHAFKDYLGKRWNGTEADSPYDPMPKYDERDFKLIKGELKEDGKIFGVKNASNGLFDYGLQYTESDEMRRWMEKRDYIYVFRLEDEGRLDEEEPNLKAEMPTLYQLVMAQRIANECERKEAMEKKRRVREAAQMAERQRKLTEERKARETEINATVCAVALETNKCALCGKIMLDPVIATDGETYEREVIEKWFQNHDVSPKAGATLTTNPDGSANKTLVPNLGIRRQIERSFSLCPELLTRQKDLHLESDAKPPPITDSTPDAGLVASIWAQRTSPVMSDAVPSLEHCGKVVSSKIPKVVSSKIPAGHLRRITAKINIIR